ncbi:PKD domain-containing protein [Marinicellulosiphila megalodicopiae]|uniref:PKD domain-containing protein n=1 Tax=Marinicellulosiphila megalodicopiae TaxID=2724896 RepID=UPI003BAF8263
MFYRILTVIFTSCVLFLVGCVPENDAPNSSPVVSMVYTNDFKSNVYIFDASNSSDPDSDNLSYLWNIDNTTYTNAIVGHTFNSKGQYYIQLTVTDARGLTTVKDAVITVVMPTVANQAPVALFTMTKKTNSIYEFDASSSSDAQFDALTYRWSIDGKSFDEKVFEYEFSASNTYVISLTVNDGTLDSIASNQSVTVALPVNNAPQIGIQVSTNFLVATFDASSTIDADSDELAYLWDINGTDYYVEKITHTFLAPGTYDYRLTVSDSNDEDQFSGKITVSDQEIGNIAPVALIEMDKQGLVISFSGSKSTDQNSDQLSYLWTIETNNGSVTYTTVSGNHTFDQAGTYSVSLKVTDTGDLSHEISENVTVEAEIVNADPIAKFEADVNGLSVMFDASESSDPDGDALEYFWQFSGQSPEGVNTSYTFSIAQTYSVKLTVRDIHGNEDSITKNVTTTNNMLISSFIATVNGLEVQLDASDSSDSDGTIVAYTWLINNTNYTGVTRNYTYNQSGTYEISLTVEDNAGNTDTSTQMVVVDESIIANTPPSPYILSTVQYGAYILFNGNNSYDNDGDLMTYAWELSTGEVFNGGKFFYEAPSTASIEATLILSDSKDRAESVTTINPMNDRIDRDYDLELFEAASSYLKCKSCHNGGQPFATEGDMSDYDSDIRSRVSSMGVNTFYSYPVDYSGHRGSGSIVTEVNKTHWLNLLRLVAADVSGANQPPVASFSYSVSGTQVTFTNTSSDPEGDNLSFEWDFGDFETSTDQHPVHEFPDNQPYYVKLKVSDANTYKTVHQKIEF